MKKSKYLRICRYCKSRPSIRPINVLVNKYPIGSKFVVTIGEINCNCPYSAYDNSILDCIVKWNQKNI